MRIALIGTRGVPPRYGGFETAVAEIGSRLAADGDQVTVYCRRTGIDPPDSWKGMRLVTLPAAPERHLETLSHTAVSVVHQLVKERSEVAIAFNAANSPLLPALRLGRIPSAVNVDGLEWKRAKWGPIGRRYYRAAERLAARWADALIADSVEIQRHYRATYQADPVFIPYGADVLDDLGDDLLAQVGLKSRGYHLVVARLEPENNVEMIVDGYEASAAELPLVVVGGVKYEKESQRRIADRMRTTPNVMALGSVWDADLLNQLYAHAFTYLHGHSAGGTNPSLLRAMGAGARVLAFDSPFNREVLGAGEFFASPGDLAGRLVYLEQLGVSALEGNAKIMKARILDRYNWDDVASDYSRLARALARGDRITGRQFDR